MSSGGVMHGLYSDMSVSRRLRIQRLCCLDHVDRLNNSAPTRRIFESERNRGRPRLRAIGVEKDLNQIGVRNWRQQARDRAS